MIPPQEDQSNLKHFDYEQYLEDGAASANDQVRMAAAADKEMF